mgnify:CR=1 FL=1
MADGIFNVTEPMVNRRGSVGRSTDGALIAINFDEMVELINSMKKSFLVFTVMISFWSCQNQAQPKEMNKYRKDLYNAYGVLKNVTKKDTTNQMLGQVKSLFEREFYGIHNSDTSEKYPRITKLLNGMQRLSAVSWYN